MAIDVKINSESSFGDRAVSSMLNPKGCLDIRLDPPKRIITITQMDAGYLVSVGCKQFAFERYETLVKHLIAYLKDPKKVELDYFGNKYKL